MCVCVGLAVTVRGVPVGGGVRVTHRLPLSRHLACNQGEVSDGKDNDGNDGNDGDNGNDSNEQ